MIYTITFNPSLDYVIQVDHFKPGIINKTKFEEILPGGKGINVSIVLSNLGHESTALGFMAGFTGEEIEHRLESYGAKTDFIHVKKGLSRINVKMKSDEETEINGMGPDIQPEDIQELLNQLDDLTEKDILVISGSIPSTLPDTMYEQIMERVQKKKIKVVVDATNNLLLKVLKYKPFLIKPNNHELGEIFNVELNTRDEVIPYAKKLQEMGAQNVLISMAGQGAVLVSDNNEVIQSKAPKGEVVNSVGAGDSMVAGFLAGYTVLLLKKILDKLPESLDGMKPVLLYPLLGIFIVGVIMQFVVEPPIGALNVAINEGLKGLNGSSAVLLGALLGGMMSVDMGGPVNKAAYVFGTASIAAGNYNIMAAVMIGGMVPPIAIALATLFFKDKFTAEQRKAGPTNFIMGLSFITEGAIPFAASDPLHVLPACAVGSAVAGGLSMAFGCTLMAPHGGIFVVPTIGNPLMYLVALVIGAFIACGLLGLLKKKVSE